METKNIVYEPYEKGKDFKKSEKPYHVLKSGENNNWQRPGRRYRIKGLFNLVEKNGEIDALEEKGTLYIKSKIIRYIISEKILLDLIDFKEKRKKRKETLEQKV